MPQKMNVVCCCTCQMYQVEIVKKAKKWQCKVCDEKQHLQKVFFEGTGKDCRLAVQNLNFSKSNGPLEVDLNSYDHHSDVDEEFFNESNSISTSEVLETFDHDVDYSTTSQVEEILEYESTEEDFQNYEFHEQSYSLNSNTDEEVEDSKDKKENSSSDFNSGKRRNDESEDFSKQNKRARKEFSFIDLIEESDSDSPAETEAAEVEAKCSIFESNCEIDFNLDF